MQPQREQAIARVLANVLEAHEQVAAIEREHQAELDGGLAVARHAGPIRPGGPLRVQRVGGLDLDVIAGERGAVALAEQVQPRRDGVIFAVDPRARGVLIPKHARIPFVQSHRHEFVLQNFHSYSLCLFNSGLLGAMPELTAKFAGARGP
jgi:hypothetical protein